MDCVDLTLARHVPILRIPIAIFVSSFGVRHKQWKRTGRQGRLLRPLFCCCLVVLRDAPLASWGNTIFLHREVWVGPVGRAVCRLSKMGVQNRAKPLVPWDMVFGAGGTASPALQSAPPPATKVVHPPSRVPSLPWAPLDPAPHTHTHTSGLGSWAG